MIRILRRFPCSFQLYASSTRPSSSSASSTRPSSSSASSTHYDVVVVGGGLVGNAAAVALALEESLENKKVLLLDQSIKEPTFNPDHGFNLRVINLTVGNQKFLARLGAWDRIQQMRYHPYDKIHCWEAQSNHSISFTAAPMGYIVENNVVEAGLCDLANTLYNVEVQRGQGVDQITLPLEPHQPVKLTLSSGDVLETDLLVGADGANSLVRRTLDPPMVQWMYNQDGIVCTLRSSCADKDSTAYQRFLASGPIALLPLGEGLFSLVWSCKAQVAAELMSLSEEEFVASVNYALQKTAVVPPVVGAMEAISDVLGMLERPPETPTISGVEGPRAKFPLGFANSSRYVGPRTALIGDAAHRVHPLAGQGANIGFRGVQELVGSISGAPHRELGDTKVLNSYETGLQRQTTPMLCFIDGMSKMYSSTAGPVVAARSYGTGVVNKLPLLKNVFLDSARG